MKILLEELFWGKCTGTFVFHVTNSAMMSRFYWHRLFHNYQSTDSLVCIQGAGQATWQQSKMEGDDSGWKSRWMNRHKWACPSFFVCPTIYLPLCLPFSRCRLFQPFLSNHPSSLLIGLSANITNFAFSSVFWLGRKDDVLCNVLE